MSVGETINTQRKCQDEITAHVEIYLQEKHILERREDPQSPKINGDRIMRGVTKRLRIFFNKRKGNGS